MGSFDRCCFQFLFNSSRFISPISAKCGNFSPSGWQPWQQLPGGPGRPEELKPAEGLWVLFPAPPSAPSGVPPFPPFPELTHRCYYSENLVCSGQQGGFFPSPQLLCSLLC